MADGGIFIPILTHTEEEITMTMVKYEVNNIWSRVRDDMDVDDLIFNYDGIHTNDDDTCSDR
jgi:hypothetical protein